MSSYNELSRDRDCINGFDLDNLDLDDLRDDLLEGDLQCEDLNVSMSGDQSFENCSSLLTTIRLWTLIVPIKNHSRA